MAGEERLNESEARHSPPTAASEPPIEPGRFDAIIVSTGLPEVLIAR